MDSTGDELTLLLNRTGILQRKNAKGEASNLYEEVIIKNFEIISELLKKLNALFARQEQFETQITHVNQKLSKFENQLDNIHTEHRRDNLCVYSNIDTMKKQFDGFDNHIRLFIEEAKIKGLHNTKFFKNDCRSKEETMQSTVNRLESTVPPILELNQSIKKQKQKLDFRDISSTQFSLFIKNEIKQATKQILQNNSEMRIERNQEQEKFGERIIEKLLRNQSQGNFSKSIKNFNKSNEIKQKKQRSIPINKVQFQRKVSTQNYFLTKKPTNSPKDKINRNLIHKIKQKNDDFVTNNNQKLGQEQRADKKFNQYRYSVNQLSQNLKKKIITHNKNISDSQSNEQDGNDNENSEQAYKNLKNKLQQPFGQRGQAGKKFKKSYDEKSSQLTKPIRQLNWQEQIYDKIQDNLSDESYSDDEQGIKVKTRNIQKKKKQHSSSKQSQLSSIIRCMDFFALKKDHQLLNEKILRKFKIMMQECSLLFANKSETRKAILFLQNKINQLISLEFKGPIANELKSGVFQQPSVISKCLVCNKPAVEMKTANTSEIFKGAGNIQNDKQNYSKALSLSQWKKKTFQILKKDKRTMKNIRRSAI